MASGRVRELRRWIVALVATLLLVVSGSGLVAFAQTGSAGSQGPQFAPQGSPLYLEARLDMPDGQGEALAQLLTAFPGFADAESFPTKREEIIESLLQMMDSDEAEELSALLSTLTGEIGLAITSLTAEDMDADEPPMVIGLAINDRSAAETALRAGAGDGVTSEAYGDATILTDAEGVTTVGVTDGWVLISPEADEVRGAVDTLAGMSPSLASDPEFTASFARVPAGHLAAAYLDFQALAPLIEAGLAQSGVEVMAMPVGDLIAQLPTDMVAYLVAEPDRLTLEALITPSEAMASVPVGESVLSDVFPADTQLYIEARDLGTTIAGALTAALSAAGEEGAAGMAPVEDMLGAPLPDFLSFIGDAGIGVGLTPESLWLGVAAETTDEALASERVGRLMSLLQLFATDPESGISVETQTVGGSEVTVITLPVDPAEMGLPFDVGQTVSVAVADGRLLIGTGDFVTTALAQDPAGSLGGSEAWTDALGADTTNSGVLYANIGSLLSQLDPLLSMMSPDWAEIAPYATALDRFVAVGTADDDVLRGRMTIIVSPAE
jgi:hypothetical protein